MKKHTWESITLKHMQEVNDWIHYKELYKLMMPELKYHNIGQKGKTPEATLRRELQSRTYTNYKKNQIWYESAGKRSGAYRIRKVFINNDSLNVEDKFRINKKAIKEKFNEEVKYAKSFMNKELIQQKRIEHEEIIMKIKNYADEYNIPVYTASSIYADIIVEPNENTLSIIEVKTTNANNIKKQCRAALGQLLEYEFKYKKLTKKNIEKHIVYSEGTLDKDSRNFLNSYLDGVTSIRNVDNLRSTIFKQK